MKTAKRLRTSEPWNGVMHHWDTLFIEVPSSTSNSVKNVNNLVEEGHQAVQEVVSK